MARLTKQERDLLEQLAQRAEAEDADDADTEVWVKNDKGHEVKLTGAKARKFLAQFGVDDDDDDQGDGDQGDDDDQGDDTKKDAKPKGGGYFGKRATK